MDALIQDVRHGVRSLLATPGFVALAVLCLGLGIGVNTTLPIAHAPMLTLRLLIRTGTEALLAAEPAREAIQAADPALRVLDTISMTEVHRRVFWRQELLGLVWSVFGAIAAALAATGVYGLLSYLVAQRSREIGVRIALGAERRNVVRLVVRQGMLLVLGGVGLGLLGAFGVTRLVRRQLYEISATDPLSFAGVALLLIAVGLLASLIPAYRAAVVDPVRSLKA